MINAEEAFIAWKNGEQVYWVYNNEKTLIDADTPLDVFLTSHSFELKPREITINGLEVPACGTNYKPHTFMLVLNSLEPCEYSKIILDESDEIPPYWWQTEEEIKQVVAALRSVFNP